MGQLMVKGDQLIGRGFVCGEHFCICFDGNNAPWCWKMNVQTVGYSVELKCKLWQGATFNLFSQSHLHRRRAHNFSIVALQ